MNKNTTLHCCYTAGCTVTFIPRQSQAPANLGNSHLLQSLSREPTPVQQLYTNTQKTKFVKLSSPSKCPTWTYPVSEGVLMAHIKNQSPKTVQVCNIFQFKSSLGEICLLSLPAIWNFNNLRQKSARFVQESYAWMIRSDLTLLYLAMIEENGANKIGAAAAISW